MSYGVELANRSGAKGSAKPKKCVSCDGKGWKHVYSQAIRSAICVQRSRFLIDYPRSLLFVSQLHGDHATIVMAQGRFYARKTGESHNRRKAI
jgi:hypothetical protein